MISESQAPPGNLDSLAEEIAELVKDISGITLNNYESNLREIGIDSMLLLELLAALEERFDISLAENIVEEFQSVNAIVRVVQEYDRV